jgi:2-oxoglutarate ferredoxin oxidoreductase subunit alpha
MTEKVVIPPAEQIDIVPRKLTCKSPSEYLPYKVNGNDVPEFARAGDGYRFHTTGLTHDERGYPVMSAECQLRCVTRLVEKIRRNSDKIVRIEEESTDGADVVVVSYGITARVARMGIEMARERGAKVGVVRLVVAWPFPERRIRELASRIEAFVVPEINCGQIALEVERCASGRAVTVPVPHTGGGVHEPADICSAILGAIR